MGLQWIKKAVDALQQAGIRARRGYPAGKMPYLTAPAVGVSLEEATAEAVTVAVWVFAPLSDGGTACEDTAILAAETLARLGARYQIKCCDFDGRTGLFSLKVLAAFSQTAAE